MVKIGKSGQDLDSDHMCLICHAGQMGPMGQKGKKGQNCLMCWMFKTENSNYLEGNYKYK